MPEYCVTGGTGFLAGHLIKALLEQGHTVRATVRDPGNVEKVGFLWEMDGAKERLKIYKADLMVENSFDEAIQGVDGVFHLAAPVFVSSDNIQESLIDPCVMGTVNVMNSCSKASSVKRIVHTSTCGAIKNRPDIQQISPINESYWSDPEYCKRYKLWYEYAKTVGEKEAWRVANENGLDLIVVHPSYVLGPLLTLKPTSTLLHFFELIKGLRGNEYPCKRSGFVHIDDVVAAHILAMEDKKASGRFLCTGPVVPWSQVIEMLRAKYPSYPYPTKCGRNMGSGNDPHILDTSKLAELGFPAFRTLEQTLDDYIKSFQDKGFL